MSSLDIALSREIYGFFVVFSRIGAAVMLLPGFGELAVPARIRLAIAALISLALLPVVPGLPERVPDGPGDMLSDLFAEALIGAFIGGTARILFASLHVAGQIIGQTTGVAAMFAMPGSAFEAGSIMGSGLMLAGLIFIFAANLHHLMIESLATSYVLMPATMLPAIEDLSMTTARAVARSFALGVQFSAPFLVVGFLFNAGLGLANRLMPALPVFFIGMPIALAGGFVIFAASAGLILASCADQIAGWLSTLQP